jgi:hypothetical protein
METNERIRKALAVESLPLPPRPKVERVELQEYTDSLGDPAVQVFVILSEKTKDSERTAAMIRPIENAIRSALDKANVGRWPYFWYRKPSEQRLAARQSAEFA